MISALPAWHVENARWLFFVRIEPAYPPAGLCWSWRAVTSNGVMWEGRRTFATRTLCEADATMHGYAGTARSSVDFPAKHG
jgi:hypothetical protein